MKKTTDKDKLKVIRESIQDELDHLEYSYNMADEISAASTESSAHVRRTYCLQGYMAMRRLAKVLGMELPPVVERPRKRFIPPSERIASAAE